jgi:hypothetical protein
MSLTTAMSSEDSVISSKDKIPKFPLKHRENVSAFFIRMKKFLSIRDLWSVTEKSVDEVLAMVQGSTSSNKGASSSPSTSSSGTSSGSKDSETKQDASTSDIRAKLVLQSQKAYYILFETLHYEQYEIFQRVEDNNAHALWNKMHDVYGVVKSNESTSSILDEITSLEKKPNQTMIEYISYAQKKVADYNTASGETLTTTLHKHYLLKGLQKISDWRIDLAFIKKDPKTKNCTMEELYDTLITEANNKALTKKQNYEEVNYNKHNNKNKFNNYNNHSNNNNNGKNNDSTGTNICKHFASTGKCNYGDKCKFKHIKQNESDNKKDKVQCFKCKKYGHYKNECPENNNKKNSYKKKINTYKKKKAYNTEAAGSDEENDGSNNHNENDNSSDGSDDTDDDDTDRVFLVEHSTYINMNTDDNNESKYKAKWILDNAASTHFTGNKSLLTSLRTVDKPIQVTTANGVTYSNTVGDAMVISNDQVGVMLKDVVFVPSFKVNLISQKRFTDKHCTVIANDQEAVIRRSDGRIMLIAKMNKNFYMLDAHAYNTNTSASTSSTINHIDSINAGGNSIESNGNNDTDASTTISNNNSKESKEKVSSNESHQLLIKQLTQLHILYGHLSYSTLHKLIKNKCIEANNMNISMINNKIIKQLEEQECAACIKGKFKRLPMTGEIKHNINSKMQMWVADVMGPIKILDEVSYLLLASDAYEKHVFVKQVSTKSEATTELIKLIKQQQTMTGKKLVLLHTDNGGEFTSSTLTDFLADNGTTITYTTPHTPQHNSMIERMIQTVMNVTRCMLIQAQAPKSLWALAAKCAVYVVNRRMSSVNNNKTIAESWSGRRVKLDHMHTWGCDAYYYKHKVQRESKVDERAAQGIFVGYDNDNDTYYYIYDMESNKIIKTRDVKFYDFKFNNMKTLYYNENNNNN